LHNNNLFNGALPAALQTAPVPEPSTWAMLFAGFAGLAFLGWRRARRRGSRGLIAAASDPIKGRRTSSRAGGAAGA
jgi:PEP-CTERM motif